MTIPDPNTNASSSGTAANSKPDSFSLRIVKLNTYIIRSKWMFGVYAGFIILLSNETLKNKHLENKLIITGTIIGIILLSFATVNFEQHLVEVRKALYEGKKGNTQVDISDQTYKTALRCFDLNFWWTVFMGIAFLFFLWFSCSDPKMGKSSMSLSGQFSHQTKNCNCRHQVVRNSIRLMPDSTYILKKETVLDSLKTIEIFRQKGQWKLYSDSLVYCTNADTSFYLKVLTDKVLLPIPQTTNGEYNDIFIKDNLHLNTIGKY